MADAKKILARLRAGGTNGPLAKLASLVVDDVLTRPLSDLVDVGALVTHIREGIASFVAADDATQRVVERVEGVFAGLAAEHRPVRAVVPPSLADAAVAFARVPTTPSREALFKLLDREPLKKLFRAQMIDALADFGRRAASPVADSSIARGLGGISKLALGSSGKNPFARVANAVSGEVERQVEKRATEFADTAVVGILTGIVDQVTDPSRRDEQAALRAAVVEGLLELTGADLAGIAHGDVPAQVAVVRAALAAWSADPAFASHIQGAVAAVIAKDAARSLGELLADFAIRDAVSAHARSVVERELTHLAAGDAFAEWLGELLA